MAYAKRQELSVFDNSGVKRVFLLQLQHTQKLLPGFIGLVVNRYKRYHTSFVKKDINFLIITQTKQNIFRRNGFFFVSWKKSGGVFISSDFEKFSASLLNTVMSIEFLKYTNFYQIELPIQKFGRACV